MMNIEEVKGRIISEVQRMDDAPFLEAIMELINTRAASGTYHLSKEQKNRVFEARGEFKSEKSISGEQLTKDVQKWLNEK